MALTTEQIRAAANDEALFDLLTTELQRLLPPDKQEDRECYFKAIEELPRGLRAMAGMHFFDVSMTLDDLAWHFGNQNDERDLRETLNGLRELELAQIADLFEQAWKIMEPHFEALRGEEVNSDNFYEWLEEIGARKKVDPMNNFIWDYCEKLGKSGLLESWGPYARKYPGRCVAIEAQS
jgi:hypothetical protein